MWYRENEIFSQLDQLSKKNNYKMTENEFEIMSQCRKYSLIGEIFGSLSGAGLFITSIGFKNFRQYIKKYDYKKIALGAFMCIIGGEFGSMLSREKCMSNLINLNHSQLSYTAKRLMMNSKYKDTFIKKI